jgi:hypothetical protein
MEIGRTHHFKGDLLANVIGERLGRPDVHYKAIHHSADPCKVMLPAPFSGHLAH